jgi:hypothetical protein
MGMEKCLYLYAVAITSYSFVLVHQRRGAIIGRPPIEFQCILLNNGSDQSTPSPINAPLSTLFGTATGRSLGNAHRSDHPA